PPAADLASQKVEVHLEFQRATLTLGGLTGNRPIADDVLQGALKLFGIEGKIKKALPSKVSVSLLKAAGSAHTSNWVTQVRNPRIDVVDLGDKLELRLTAEMP